MKPGHVARIRSVADRADEEARPPARIAYERERVVDRQGVGRDADQDGLGHGRHRNGRAAYDGDVSGGVGFGAGDPEAFKDAPLFQELQRVMSSSSGPVNWELARQVGVANAVESGPDPEPTEGDARLLEEAVRVAELQVGRFTGLAGPADVAQVRAVRRAAWVNANAENLKALLEPAARRLTDAIERSAGEQLPAEAAPWRASSAALPMLLGAQVGQVLGMLAQRVLGQYDIAVPRSGPGQLLFVVPNLSTFERDWSLDPREFRTFVALHEVTHRFEFAQPWVRDHFQALLDDYLSALTLDMDAMQSRFVGPFDPADPEALSQLADDDPGLFWADLDDEQRLKLEDPGVHGGSGGVRRSRDAGARVTAPRHVPDDRGGDEALPGGRARRPGVRAAARRRHEARAVPHRPGVLRGRRRADRRDHARADVGLGRGAALAPRARRAAPVARPHGLSGPHRPVRYHRPR